MEPISTQECSKHPLESCDVPCDALPGSLKPQKHPLPAFCRERASPRRLAQPSGTIFLCSSVSFLPAHSGPSLHYPSPRVWWVPFSTHCLSLCVYLLTVLVKLFRSIKRLKKISGFKNQTSWNKVSSKWKAATTFYGYNHIKKSPCGQWKRWTG